GMGGIVIGILLWQEGAERVLIFIVVGAAALALFAWWLVRRKRAGKPSLIDPDLFRSALFRLGISGQLLQQISLGGLMIVLPIYLQMVFEYNALEAGLSIIPIVPRADAGWQLALSLIVGGSGLGLLVSQLNNYTLSPIDEEHVSEAAGVNSAGGSFGLSFGRAFDGSIMLATLSISFTHKAESSSVIPEAQQEQIADALEDDAQVMSNTQLQEI